MQDPEKIRAGMDRLVQEERPTQIGDPEQEAGTWTQKIDERDHLRAGYQNQQAAGYMTMNELCAKLKELEGVRELAQVELKNLLAREERIEELEWTATS